MHRGVQWKHYALVVVASLMLLTVQSHLNGNPNQDELYRSIELHFVSGDLTRADTESRRAAFLDKGNDPQWAAKFRVQQAKVWVYQGRYREAIVLLKPPLPHALPDATLAITRSTLLSIAYRRSSDPENARQALVSAQALCPNEAACGEVRLAQGVVEVENDQLADAANAFELSLLSGRNRGDNFLRMQALLNLGVVALRQEHYDDALDRFADASAVARVIGARLALEKATGNVGWALYKLGDYRKALANSKLAAEQAALLGSPIDEVRWLNDAGLSQFRLGDFEAAKFSYQHSLQLARSIQNKEETGDALVALASLSLKQGDFGGALRQSLEAVQLAKQRGNDSDVLRPSLIEALALQRQGQTSNAREQFLHLEQISSVKPSVRWDAENALAKLSAETGDTLAANAWFRRAIDTFRSERSSVTNIDSRLPFIENGESLYLSYVEYLVHQGKVNEALAILDEGRAETLGEGLDRRTGPHPRTASPGMRDPRILARRSNATILVYCLRPQESYLWAVSSNATRFFRLPGQEIILPLVDRFTRGVRSSQDILAQDNGTGTALFRDLVGPVDSLIPPHSNVFIIADQGMYGLNFETLPISSDRLHFWIEDVTISNARSLALLARSQPASQKGAGHKRLLLIGDPTYTRPEFQSLPHAHEEVASIAEHFAPTQRLLLTGTEANPAAYQRSNPADFAYIHFVSHGVGNDTDPLDSAVVLSPSPGVTESYKLYARAILDQRLHADLVTISSCYGSGVRAYAGEGLIGLTWAFLRAGSHNVIGALWEVNDASTPHLMSELYDGLARGNSPPDALRAAKLSMIHSSGVFRKPYYWASFQLYAGA